MQTITIRLVATDRSGLGKSIGGNGGEISEGYLDYTATAAEPFWIDSLEQSAAERTSTLQRI